MIQEQYRPWREFLNDKSRHAWKPPERNLFVAIEPQNKLQRTIFDNTLQQLGELGFIEVTKKKQETTLGTNSDNLVHGDGTLEGYNDVRWFSRMKKPRGDVVMLNTVPELPNQDLRLVARTQLFRKGGHLGITFEGDSDGHHIRRALIGSMQGNTLLVEGTEEEIYDNAIFHILMTLGARDLNKRYPEPSTITTWQEWNTSPVHQETHTRAQLFGPEGRGIIQDRVNIEELGEAKYITTRIHLLPDYILWKKSLKMVVEIIRP
jgi:hypothetical protein